VTASLPRQRAVRLIVGFGLVSLCADITYEGARSILGPFFVTLGAGAAVVGIIAGAGELFGFALRLVSGMLADRTRAYWTITILGYSVNLLAVPALAFAGNWPTAAALVIAERTGKSIRAPARDVMLSHAVHQVGRGWGFGLHAAMDQCGAVLGPLIVTAVLARTQGFSSAFEILAIPALLAIVLLLIARSQFPHPHELEPATRAIGTAGLGSTFWLYVAAAGTLAAGYFDFPLAAYHLEKHAVIGTSRIPLLYSAAMAANAAGALLFGRIYDRIGVLTMPLAIVLSAASVPLSFASTGVLALAGMVCWGLGIGAQDAVLRAGVAAAVPPDRRGAAYGAFNAVFGVMWFAGSAAMGLLYGRSIVALIAFGIAAQAVAAVLFTLYSRRVRP
jgi:MFS family permease